MNLDDVSDDEFRLLMTAPVDNLKKQRARAGVSAPAKGTDPFDSMSDEDFARAMGGAIPAKAKDKSRAEALLGVAPDDIDRAKTKPPIREYDMRDGLAVPRGPAGPSPQDITTEELYALGSSPQTLRADLGAHGPPAKKEPGFLERAGQNWKRAITDPAGEASREFGMLGSAATRAADAASLGYYSKLRNAVGGAVAPEATQQVQQTEQTFDREHPFVSGMATGAGYLAPMGGPAAVGKIAGRVGEAVAGAVPRMLSRPVAGAVTGALGAGTVAGSEAAVDGRSGEEILHAALNAGKYGAAFGGAIGAAQGTVGRLAEGADKRISARNVSDFTEGASAARRDRVVGKGGVKYDRVDALARRTPELEAAGGDPLKQAPIVQEQINRVGSQLDDIGSGTMTRPDVIVEPMRSVAREIRTRAHTGQEAETAAVLEQEADRVMKTWPDFSKKGRPNDNVQPESASQTTSVGVPPRDPTVRVSADSMRNLGYGHERVDYKPVPPVSGTADTQLFDPRTPKGMVAQRSIARPPPEVGYIDYRDARQMITNYGKGLYGGNPNTAPTIPKAIRQEVYRRQVEALGKTVEHFKPGVGEELSAANAEMSDWLNINDAVTARSSRAATPGMTLKGQAHDILDFGLGVLHPGHYLAKKGLEHLGPGALRGVDRELSTMGPGGALLQSANPLINALDSTQARNRQRAEAIKRSEETAAQFKQRQADEEAQRRMLEAFQNSQQQN